jgi:hypothetical protein
LASPSLTGTPLSTTAAVDTNTTQIATTAFVVGQAAAATPLVNGTAAVGTSLRYARADHVHPTDTTRLAVANNLSDLNNVSTARNNIRLRGEGSDDLLETRLDGVTPALVNTSMTAVAQRANSNIWNMLNYGSAVASGSIQHWISPFDGQWYGFNGWNFSKAGNAVVYLSSGIGGGASSVAAMRFYWGRRNTDAVGTDLASKGFQIRFESNGTTNTTNFGVHNGTSLTEVSIGNTTAGGFNKYVITWDGSGNFTCFRNGTQVATTSAGPTGSVNEGNGIYVGVDYKANTGNTAFHTNSYLNTFTMRGAF